MLNQFHFLQPYWLLALIPLAIVWWLMTRTKETDSKAWAKVIDARLLPLLLSNSNDTHQSSTTLGKWLLAFGWVIATLALADPVWEKVPRPIFQTNAARVIVLDLSSSMLIADLKPSRLARARFKIEDILSENFAKKEEGQIGLVLFAGDAFTASPLTRDSETIKALLQVLTPRIMPSQGSRVDLGLKKAHELLTQAGVKNGQVLLIADGVSDQSATLKMAKSLNQSGHTLSVLGVGTETGGVLPALRYKNGKPITVKLESAKLKKIAQAGGGYYHLISTSNVDLNRVLTKPLLADLPQEKNKDQESADWKSTGPIIILLILPFAALAFRRGWLFSVFIVASLIGITHPQTVIAAPIEKTTSLLDKTRNNWENIWKNKEQQADVALKEQDYEKVKELSENPLLQGVAKYKTQEYQEALKDFEKVEGADARYNEGNTLAKMGKYKEAIEAYDKALKLQPDMKDALDNKAMVEKLLKQKQKQKHKSDNKQNNKNKQKDGKPKQDKKEGEGKKSSGDKGKKGENKKNEGNKNQAAKDKKKEENQFSKANKDLDKKAKDKGDKDSQDQQAAKKDPKEKAEKNTENSTEKNAEKKNSKRKKDLAKKDGAKDKPKEKPDQKGSKAKAKELSKEEKMAAEQWLRRIPDDPGGLLRRKFQRQYQQRRRYSNNNSQPW